MSDCIEFLDGEDECCPLCHEDETDLIMYLGAVVCCSVPPEAVL